jgi:hypothetical protein
MKKVRLFSLAVISTAILGIGSQTVTTYNSSNQINTVYAWDGETDSSNSNQANSDSSRGNGSNQQQGSSNSSNRDQNNISDQLKGYKSISPEDMQNARANSQWLTSIIGVAISFLIIAVFAFTGFITACDLLYMYVPFVRKFLYSPGTDGTGAMTGMGGTGSTSLLNFQWVSDEAVAVASMLGGSAQATGHMSGGMPGVMGGGGFGGPAFGMGAQNPQVQQNGGKSPIRVYIGKRLVALTLLGVASVLLFTSAFTDFGINVGGLLLQILSIIQEKLLSIGLG